MSSTFRAVLAFGAVLLSICVIPSGGKIMVCNEVESICGAAVIPEVGGSAQGPPGKRGAPGEKGERGELRFPGERGPVGFLNEEDKENIHESIMSEVKQLLTQKLIMMRKATGTCDVEHDAKCYGIIRETGYTMSLAKAQYGCERLGGTLADIYDEGHYNKLVAFVRSELIRSSETTQYFWTGMRYDLETKTLTLRDGTTAPNLKWASGYPKNASSYIFMAVATSESPTGLYDYPLPNPRKAAFCEFAD